MINSLITCLFPREPKCGVATVMKFTGSNPAILSWWNCSICCFCSSLEKLWAASEDFNWGIWSKSLPTAYLATSPPKEWATKEIFCNSGLRLMTPNTCIGWSKVRSSTEISIRMLFLNFSEMDHKYIYRTKIPLQPVFLPLCQPHQMLILKNYTHCLLKKIILEAKKLIWPVSIKGWHRGVPTQCIANKFNIVKG